MNDRELDGGMIRFGVMLGLAIGGFVTLWTAPLSGRALLRRAQRQIEVTRVRVDPVESSLSEGRDLVRAIQRDSRR